MRVDSSLVTYGMFFYLAATGNITSVSALIFLTPVFALLFSSLLLGEQLTSFQWAGVVLTLISVYLVIQREEIAKRFATVTTQMSAEAQAIASTDVAESIAAIPEAVAAKVVDPVTVESAGSESETVAE